MRYRSAQIETASGLKSALSRATGARCSGGRTWREMREATADADEGRNYWHIKLQFQAGREKDRREILDDIAESDTAVSGPCDGELQIYATNVSIENAMSKDAFEGESGVAPDI